MSATVKQMYLFSYVIDIVEWIILNGNLWIRIEDIDPEAINEILENFPYHFRFNATKHEPCCLRMTDWAFDNAPKNIASYLMLDNGITNPDWTQAVPDKTWNDHLLRPFETWTLPKEKCSNRYRVNRRHDLQQSKYAGLIPGITSLSRLIGYLKINGSIRCEDATDRIWELVNSKTGHRCFMLYKDRIMLRVTRPAETEANEVKQVQNPEQLIAVLKKYGYIDWREASRNQYIWHIVTEDNINAIKGNKEGGRFMVYEKKNRLSLLPAKPSDKEVAQRSTACVKHRVSTPISQRPWYPSPVWQQNPPRHKQIVSSPQRRLALGEHSLHIVHARG